MLKVTMAKSMSQSNMIGRMFCYLLLIFSFSRVQNALIFKYHLEAWSSNYLGAAKTITTKTSGHGPGGVVHSAAMVVLALSMTGPESTAPPRRAWTLGSNSIFTGISFSSMVRAGGEEPSQV